MKNLGGGTQTQQGDIMNLPRKIMGDTQSDTDGYTDRLQGDSISLILFLKI
jgi:hypothetical protein